MNEDYITPQEAFEIPILKILLEIGGCGTTYEVLTRLEEELKLLDGDRKLLESGQIRWQKNAAVGRYKLAKKGEVDSPQRGIWHITEKGKKRYEKEGKDYKQEDYPPRLFRLFSPRSTRKKRLIDPRNITTDLLQKWGIKQELNLFELGLEGVKRKYEEYYRKNKGLDNEHILTIIKRTIRDINAFLSGELPSSPTAEKVCQWVDYCYLFEMYWEGSELFKKVSKESIPEELYKRTKKIADACLNNL